MHESRMLVDGKLVDAESKSSFANINPATEEVLGDVADATRGDMERAINAARTAFDTGDWALDHDARRAGLLQLQDALKPEREELRGELVAEVGCPILTTFGPQLDVPMREALRWPAAMIGEFPWSRSLEEKGSFRHRHSGYT